MIRTKEAIWRLVKERAFHLDVNYDRSIKDSIQAGFYHHFNKKITDENFPDCQREHGVKTISVRLFNFRHLGYWADTSEIIIRFSERKCRPASLRELLAFGEKKPNQQRKFRIVELFSIWADPLPNYDLPAGTQWTASLAGGAERRRLDLSGFNNIWNPDTRFLAVLK